ncbi:hypothetical protein [Bacillus toyonensis]|uniref:hypothetical protein n=1 Tax=Bacillus toyonensis TaxID=155322 RepID=UPI002E1E9E6C|nr:hypothetical protein [Bacillus toyonensis]
MSVYNLEEQEIIYLTNSLGEATNNSELPEDAYKWYEGINTTSTWLLYLAKWNGQVGILAIDELSWDVEPENLIKNWIGLTVYEIRDRLDVVAKKIDTNVNFNVLLGKETGFLARHEMCIWFPNGTSEKSIESTLKEIDSIGY